MPRRAWIALLAMSWFAFARLEAQTSSSVLLVTVGDARTGALLPHARIAVLGTLASAETDSLGEARLPGIPAGTHIVVVRRLGYEPLQAPIHVSGRDSLGIVLRVQPLTVSLPAVIVRDSAPAPWLTEFDERRRTRFGRFITRDEIRAAMGSDFPNLVAARIPGVWIQDGRLFSRRGANNARAGACQAAVYLNGMRERLGKVDEVPFMLLSGIEYYSPGWVPVQYKEMSALGADGVGKGGSAACGVLLLWSGP